MQIVHKINDFIYTNFPKLENTAEKKILNAIQKDYIISSINNKRFSDTSLGFLLCFLGIGNAGTSVAFRIRVW